MRESVFKFELDYEIDNHYHNTNQKNNTRWKQSVSILVQPSEIKPKVISAQ